MADLRDSEEYEIYTEITYKGIVRVKAYSHEDAVDIIEIETELNRSPMFFPLPSEDWEQSVETKKSEPVLAI